MALACLLLAPAAAQASPATLKGKLTGVKLPAAAKGASSVRAMNVNTSRVAGADYTDRQGRFNLKAPPGAYGLLASVLPYRGPKVIEKVVGRVRLKSGRTRSVKLPVKKQPAQGSRRARSSVKDGFGDVSVDHPAIAVHSFDAGNAEQYLGKGIADMLITDLLNEIAAKKGCKAILVERMRIGDVLDELERSKGPMFDPGTRPQDGKIIRDNAKVTGTLAHTGGVIYASTSYTDLKTGKVTTFADSASDSDPNAFFEMEQRLAKKLAEHVCEPAINRFSGTWTRIFTTSLRPGWRQTVQGAATFVRNPLFGSELDGQTSIPFEVESASVTWTVSGSNPAGPGCTATYSGSGTDSWTPAWDGTAMTLHDVRDNPRAPKPEPTPFYYSIRATGAYGDEHQFTISYSGSCDSTSYQENINPDYLEIGHPGEFDEETDPDRFEKSASETLLEGRRVRPEGAGHATDDSWHFTGSE